MKILHLVNALNNEGNGLVNVAVDLAASQRAAGHTVAVASPAGTLLPFLAESGVSHYPINFELRIGSFLRSYAALQSVLNTFRPDVVHCHTVTAFFVAKACQISRSYVLITHVHNIHERRSRFLRWADQCIAVSEAVAHDLRKSGTRAGHISVLYNCSVESPRAKWAARQRTGSLDLRQPAIVTVAGMNLRKNIDGLIDAFTRISAAHPEAHLYLVGDGPDRQTFEQLAAKSSARERIHFEGFQADPAPYMRAAHVFVLASHRESFGMVLHEARENGAPIIATAVDGIPEALDNGAAGVLVPAGDTEALAGAIDLLLRDEETRQRWKLAGKSNLGQTVASLAEQVEAVYDEVMERTAKKVPAHSSAA
jgi:glycosyltransferase involved in cell wall biosynthesis